ncbi:protein FAR1-RELATED SEQUENCE 5-like [Pyrus ussuriensis x Pyrus communis]|uniref:Protein FAR1-RELATED SEQUENCE 5-like n=1 Tax=Pyrus ussuriensis x Pyrus communis TaxID=2448454 RepID=A0A5N5GJC1_9ROSA|nr:protein FAR1-RELATED SEQUENCE 5-like [Pyrus ussuriensis x Pyrus communis]
MLIEHFKDETTKIIHSISRWRLTKALENLFWADAKSRHGYGLFGDVIVFVFDTTFNTNVYEIMFALLLGVNNHGQTIVFGCAFLKNKKTESIGWLFEEMLKATLGELLKQTTFHQYYIWHIGNKFNDKGWVGAVFKDLHYCIWDIESKEELEVVGDHNDENCAPPLQLHMPMEEQMFQVEELKSLTYFLKEQSRHENEAVYEVLERATGVTKMKKLMADTTSGYDKWRDKFSKKASNLIDKVVMSEKECTQAPPSTGHGDVTEQNEAANPEPNSMITQSSNIELTSGNSGMLDDFYEYMMNDH